MPYLLALVLANAGAAVADRLLLDEWGWTILKTRRCVGALSQLGPALALAILAGVRGPVAGTILASVAIGMGALVQSGFWANVLDIAPNHSGILLGISNTIASLPGVLANLATGYMLHHGLGWGPVFAIGALLELTGATVFVSLASGEPQF